MRHLEISYLAIEPVKCDCCGEWVESYSDRSGWFGKYLKHNEERICRNCIKGRDGYAVEFFERIGVSVELLED